MEKLEIHVERVNSPHVDKKFGERFPEFKIEDVMSWDIASSWYYAEDVTGFVKTLVICVIYKIDRFYSAVIFKADKDNLPKGEFNTILPERWGSPPSLPPFHSETSEWIQENPDIARVKGVSCSQESPVQVEIDLHWRI